MQQVEGTLSGGTEDPSEPKHPGFLSPGRAFLLLLIPLALAALWLWTSRESPPPDVATETAPRVLTDAEAIATFEELHELLLQAYRTRDPSLVKLFAAPDSPHIGEQDSEAIVQLTRDGVVDKTRYERSELTILMTTEDEITIREVTAVYPSYVDEETGQEVGTGTAEEETIIWTLRRYENGWRIYEGLIIETRKIRDAAS